MKPMTPSKELGAVVGLDECERQVDLLRGDPARAQLHPLGVVEAALSSALIATGLVGST